ncbi:MAG TPA: SRPBCC domain-containing protein [Pyrinomonadaceae bacterium]|nr:SRPBCC domain-containing protein [Pyrinomonadaceae bacterium]
MSPESEPITVVKEKFIPAGIDEVWKCLTDGILLTQWFATTDGLTPDGGFVFDFGDGDFFSGQVVHWQAPTSLGFTWKFLGVGQMSRIDYSLQPEGESTFLVLRDHGALTPEEAVGLDEGWDDFLMRLSRRIETGQPCRYRWTETFGGAAFLGNDTPITVSDFDDSWWRANFPGIHITPDPVQPNTSNAKRFIVRDDAWSAWGDLTTTATLRVRHLPGGVWASVSHEGWVKFPESEQVGERRRFARLWENALRRLEENPASVLAASVHTVSIF